jgi:separase
MATTSRRTVSRKPSKSLKNGTSSADSLAGDFATKLAIGNPVESKLSAMLSVNAASQDLSRVIQSGWKKSSSSSRATLQSTTSSASAAVKQVAILRNLCPEDVDVERAAASILGKLVALELVCLLLYKAV